VALERGSEHYGAINQSMKASVSALDDIVSMTDLISDGVEALRERAKEVNKDLGNTIDRYEKASSALSTYASALRSAQSNADALLEEARSAEQRHTTLVNDRNYWLRLEKSAIANGDTESAPTYRRRADDLIDDIAAAQRRLVNARDEDLPPVLAARDGAAEEAIGAFNDAIENGPKDGWWENWGADLFAIISQVASIVAAITGVLALVLCWVPILGQVLAAIATVATAVALIADIVLALTGEKGWGDVVLGVVALATLGIGRIATNAFRIASLARAGEGLSSVAIATERAAVAGAKVEGVVVNVGVRTTQVTKSGTSGFQAFRDVLSAEGGVGALFEGSGPIRVAKETLDSLGQISNLHGVQGTAYLIERGAADLVAAPPSARFAQLLGMFDEADNLSVASSLRGADASMLADMGMAAPNSAAFGASVTLPSGANYSMSFTTSFDGLVGGAPLASAGAAVAGVTGINAVGDIGDTADFAGQASSPGFDFYSWITDSAEEHNAPQRLGLR
jgi:tetratricopeptide (TPR) repeat protein